VPVWIRKASGNSFTISSSSKGYHTQMSILLIVIHIVVCVALILIVLLQTGKGADMGAAFGGGASQTLFGSTGASTFLSKATTVAAVVFMLTSLVLAYMSSNRPGRSVMDQEAPAPVTQPATPDQSQPAPAESQNTPASATATKPAPATDTKPAPTTDPGQKDQ
jgi:preprotein translocase subunit SecG